MKRERRKGCGEMAVLSRHEGAGRNVTEAEQAGALVGKGVPKTDIRENWVN